jgi:hypothetical protein
MSPLKTISLSRGGCNLCEARPRLPSPTRHRVFQVGSVQRSQKVRRFSSSGGSDKTSVSIAAWTPARAMQDARCRLAIIIRPQRAVGSRQSGHLATDATTSLVLALQLGRVDTTFLSLLHFVGYAKDAVFCCGRWSRQQRVPASARFLADNPGARPHPFPTRSPPRRGSRDWGEGSVSIASVHAVLAGASS